MPRRNVGADFGSLGSGVLPPEREALNDDADEKPLVSEAVDPSSLIRLGEGWTVIVGLKVSLHPLKRVLAPEEDEEGRSSFGEDFLAAFLRLAESSVGDVNLARGGDCDRRFDSFPLLSLFGRFPLLAA